MINVKEDMTGWVMSEHGVPKSRWVVLERADGELPQTINVCGFC